MKKIWIIIAIVIILLGIGAYFLFNNNGNNSNQTQQYQTPTISGNSSATKYNGLDLTPNQPQTDTIPPSSNDIPTLA
jgi:flagellar basal body-associated protein FliL